MARLSIARFSFSIGGVTILAHVPFALAALSVTGTGFVGVAVSLAASAGLVAAVRGRVRLAFDDEPISPLRRWAVELPYFVHWCAAVGSIPAALLLAPLLALGALGLFELGGYAYGLALVASVWAVLFRPRMLRLRTRRLDVPDLPHAFDGYRILHVSDVHLGSLFPAERLEAWLSRAAGLRPDLVALTGDYVTTGTRFHEQVAASLSTLTAPDGSFAVCGNHDDFGGGEPLRSSLRAKGITLLENEHRTIERADARLVVVGVDDVYSRRADVARAFHGVPSGAFVLALAHEPGLFPSVAERGARLVLSGHTHWGQLAVPFFAERLNLARVFYRYASGVDRYAGALLHTSPGLGTTFVPARLGAAPEMTLLVLRRLDASDPPRGTSAEAAISSP